ncbi:Protein TPLATE [Linum perenne]
MDLLFAQIQADLRSNDALRHRQDCCRRDRCCPRLRHLQEARLRLDPIHSPYRRSGTMSVLGSANDLHFPDPDVTAAAISILAAMPSYSLSKVITDCRAEISSCFDSPSDNLRFSINETLGSVLARDDLVTLGSRAPLSSMPQIRSWMLRRFSISTITPNKLIELIERRD